jgi:hypothetical protein
MAVVENKRDCSADTSPQPTRQVIYVMGTAYCGSTLLNHLLDAQPGVRGLSEASCWFLPHTKAWCSRCYGPITECVNYPRLGGKPDFYQRLFDLYPDAHTVVNCAKHPSLLFRIMPLPPPKIPCRCVLLSKMPHEFAWSYRQHEGGDPAAGILGWIEIYEWILACLKAADARDEDFFYYLRLPVIAAADVLRLSYRQLALEPAAAVERICRKWSIPFDEEAATNPWARPSDTCMVGGNTAVYAQRVTTPHFFEDPSYLGGKYVGKRHTIFLDRQWRSDRQFVDACRECYDNPRLRAGIDALATDLGYPRGTAAFAEDLAQEDRGADPRDGQQQ